MTPELSPWIVALLYGTLIAFVAFMLWASNKLAKG